MVSGHVLDVHYSRNFRGCVPASINDVMTFWLCAYSALLGRYLYSDVVSGCVPHP